MGWFKSAEEKAAEKRKKEEAEIQAAEAKRKADEAVAEAKKKADEAAVAAKKKATEEKKKKEKQKILDFILSTDKHEIVKNINQNKDEHETKMAKYEISIHGDLPGAINIEDLIRIDTGYKKNSNKSYSENIRDRHTYNLSLIQELIKENQLFTYNTWKGTPLDNIDALLFDWEDDDWVFTESFVEWCIAEEKKSQNELKVEKNRIDSIIFKIISLLKEKAVKMPASDIDAFLKHQNVDEIKELCEQMYHNGEISRTANYRYFILSEEKKKPKKVAAKKADPTAEIRKYAKLRDDGIITEEDFQKKKKELLGL